MRMVQKWEKRWTGVRGEDVHHCMNKREQKGCKGEGRGSVRPSQIGKSENSLLKALEIKETYIQQ